MIEKIKSIFGKTKDKTIKVPIKLAKCKKRLSKDEMYIQKYGISQKDIHFKYDVELYIKETGLAWIQEFGSRLNINYAMSTRVDMDYVHLYRKLYKYEDQSLDVDEFMIMNDVNNCGFDRDGHYLLRYSFERGFKNIQFMSELYLKNNKELELIKEMKKEGINYKHFIGENNENE